MRIDQFFDTDDISSLAKTVQKYNISLNRLFRLYKKLYAENMELKRKLEEKK